MPYEDLLKQRAIEPVEVSRREIVEHLRAAKRDISTSLRVISIDRDWAFNIAYSFRSLSNPEPLKDRLEAVVAMHMKVAAAC